MLGRGGYGVTRTKGGRTASASLFVKGPGLIPVRKERKGRYHERVISKWKKKGHHAAKKGRQ